MKVYGFLRVYTMGLASSLLNLFSLFLAHRETKRKVHVRLLTVRTMYGNQVPVVPYQNRRDSFHLRTRDGVAHSPKSPRRRTLMAKNSVQLVD